MLATVLYSLLKNFTSTDPKLSHIQVRDRAQETPHTGSEMNELDAPFGNKGSVVLRYCEIIRFRAQTKPCCILHQGAVSHRNLVIQIGERVDHHQGLGNIYCFDSIAIQNRTNMMF